MKTTRNIDADSDRPELEGPAAEKRASLRDITPVSVNRVLDYSGSDDRLDDMLKERGKRP